ncbi:MAG: hypothetical protein PVG42_14385 [Lysobacterales bacterium]|jgi:hypothetical protein
MSEKEESARKEIDRQVDELIKWKRKHIYGEDPRDITKMQSPDPWPDPPSEESETHGGTDRGPKGRRG